MYLYRGLSLLHHNQTVRRNNEVRSKSDQANEACLHSALKADFFFPQEGLITILCLSQSEIITSC